MRLLVILGPYFFNSNRWHYQKDVNTIASMKSEKAPDPLGIPVACEIKVYQVLYLKIYYFIDQKETIYNQYCKVYINYFSKDCKMGIMQGSYSLTYTTRVITHKKLVQHIQFCLPVSFFGLIICRIKAVDMAPLDYSSLCF